MFKNKNSFNLNYTQLNLNYTRPPNTGALLPSMGVCLNPSAAACIMSFSSVAVVSNSLLLRAHFDWVKSKGVSGLRQSHPHRAARLLQLFLLFLDQSCLGFGSLVFFSFWPL